MFFSDFQPKPSTSKLITKRLKRRIKIGRGPSYKITTQDQDSESSTNYNTDVFDSDKDEEAEIRGNFTKFGTFFLCL